ncbi:MAG: hypothetical protein N3F63_07275 [Thermoplasmata archaeon]|nr:hypothetical protein [Thermoplasmata archaeon]
MKKSVEFFREIKRENIDYYKALFELGKVARDREMMEASFKFFERIGNRAWADKVEKALVALK